MLGLWLAITIAASPDAGPFDADLPAPEDSLQLDAERLLHDGKRELTTGEGGAQLRGDSVAIDADRLVYDARQRVATAIGRVVARVSKGGKVAVIADLLTLRFDENNEVTEIYLYQGQAISKRDVSAQRLLAANTAEKVERVGTTQALLQGNHLVRDGSTWTVEELSLVPCECDFKNPGWSIGSNHAVVDTEADRVAISNAVVRIGKVPVLWLPWISLPLTDRQSGLLFPYITPSSPLTGFSLEQPVFVTLGRSADVTLTPGLFTGAFPNEKGVQNPTGVAGPRLNTEFRYAPSTRAAGRAVLGLLYDFRTKRDVENPTLRVPGTFRGWRGELSWLHTQDFDHGFGARVDFNGHSDGDYNRDLTVDVIASAATYLRSAATLFHRSNQHSLALDVGLRQDIQWGYDWLGNGTLLNASRVIGFHGPGTLQRLPAITLGWSPDPLGPVHFSMDAEAARLAPLFSLTGDEGSSAAEGRIDPISFKTSVARLFNPSSPYMNQAFGGIGLTTGMGNRVWEPGEREARDRLMLRPTLSVSVSPLDAFTFSASASWRQLAWVGEASGRSWTRGYLLLGGALETQLSRRFDSGLKHVITPRFEVRALPFGFQTGPTDFVAYDHLDAAVPNVDGRVQGVVELSQRLLARGGGELLRLDVGQGGEFAQARSGGPLTANLGEAYGRFVATFGWLSMQGLLRIDPLATRFASDGLTPVTTGLTRAAGRADLDDGRGHGAYVTYENLVMEGTARSRQPVDLLFQIDRGYTSLTRVQQITFGARWEFGVVGVRYDAMLNEQIFPAFNSTPLTLLAFNQHTLSVGVTPACDCMRIDLFATQPIPWNNGKPVWLFPSAGLRISVAKFGSIGTR